MGGPVVQAALRFAPMVFVRTGELRHAEWREIDTEKAEWRIPAEKMKQDRIHIVPLSTQALDILEELRPITGAGRHVFPSIRTAARPISENTINAALRRLGHTRDEMTGHGFRSMASTLLNEQGWNRDVIDGKLPVGETPKTEFLVLQGDGRPAETVVLSTLQKQGYTIIAPARSPETPELFSNAKPDLAGRSLP